MSWLSNALGQDKRREQAQLRQWQGAGPGRRLELGAINEGQRAGTREQQYQESRNRYLDAIQGGQQAFETSARSAVAAAMPQFNQQLEGVRASAIRRGVNTGELGTSYEGDLASAFQKNIANAIGGQALGLYGQQLGAYGSMYGQDLGAEEASTNRYYDLVTANLDKQNQERERKRRNQQQLGAIGGGIIGGAIGRFTGGWGGVLGGARTGSRIGGGLG